MAAHLFGYSNCPGARPTALNTIGAALRSLGPEAEKFRPLFNTVDPKRDTPELPAEHLKSFDPRIVELTGTEKQTPPRPRPTASLMSCRRAAETTTSSTASIST